MNETPKVLFIGGGSGPVSGIAAFSAIELVNRMALSDIHMETIGTVGPISHATMRDEAEKAMAEHGKHHLPTLTAIAMPIESRPAPKDKLAAIVAELSAVTAASREEPDIGTRGGPMPAGKGRRFPVPPKKLGGRR